MKKTPGKILQDYVDKLKSFDWTDAEDAGLEYVIALSQASVRACEEIREIEDMTDLERQAVESVMSIGLAFIIKVLGEMGLVAEYDIELE